MRAGVLSLGILIVGGITGVTRDAHAEGETPPARIGFQMAIRTGYSVPMGKFDGGAGGANLSDVVSGQVPFIADIGAKIIPSLFLGGYFGIGIGGTGSALNQACNSDGISCFAVTVHVGVEAQLHFLPQTLANPWIGYGLGYESLALSASSSDGQSTTSSYGGFEFAHLMAGLDLRLTRGFGVGPFFDFSFAQYSTSGQDSSLGVEIPNSATHEWLTLGARFVIFP
jgi:hypothetical protein